MRISANRRRHGRAVSRLAISCLAGLTLGVASLAADAAEPVKLTVQVDRPGARIDPGFYGLMTEEINYSYDGGLYGELIRNRAFLDLPRRSRGQATAPATTQGADAHLIDWSLVTDGGGQGAIAIDTAQPVNAALPNSLRLDVRPGGGRVGVANGGYWGIPVRPNESYRASFYARAGEGFAGPLTVAIESEDGATSYATAAVPTVTSSWQRYEVTLKTAADVAPTARARFVVSAGAPGTVWLSFVSLFPPTYKDRPNGNRRDLMQLLADLRPSFLRFPGGNYVEGSDYENRFDWKKTVGPVDQRPGHMSPWGYRSTDGMGLLEFLRWCEELNMEPVLAVYAGLHLDRGRDIRTGEALAPHVQEALDEIEYVTGDAATTKWGARRAADGHPEPFKLRYVEVGNEDWLNNGLATYDERFRMFYDAIKAKYPQIQVISTIPNDRGADKLTSRRPDLIDDHYYMSIPDALNRAHMYDKRDRSAPKVFVGEWATRVGNPTPTMGAAFGDAAFLTGLERNADVVTMHCYAPLLVNVSPGGMQWPTDLIGYDALRSYGSPAYYVQRMFSEGRGDVVLPATLDPLPKIELDRLPKPPPGNRPATTMATTAATRPRGPQGPFDAVYVSASRQDASGDVILKLVNVQDEPQPLDVDLGGAAPAGGKATVEVLAADPAAVNTLDEPQRVAPKRQTIDAAGPRFRYELPPHSVSVVRVPTR